MLVCNHWFCKLKLIVADKVPPAEQNEALGVVILRSLLSSIFVANNNNNNITILVYWSLLKLIVNF